MNTDSAKGIRFGISLLALGLLAAGCGSSGSTSTSSGGGSGAGLGLALSRRLAAALGGQVDCLDSDSGARFRVRIPPG